MKGTARPALTNMLYQLIDDGLLERTTDERPVLRLTDASREVLRGNRSVRLLQPKTKVKNSLRRKILGKRRRWFVRKPCAICAANSPTNAACRRTSCSVMPRCATWRESDRTRPARFSASAASASASSPTSESAF